MHSLPDLSLEKLKDHILSKGRQWYDSNPLESETIKKNCLEFGLDCDAQRLKNIQHHILLHYYEKLIPFTMTPHRYAEYLKTRMTLANEISFIKESLSQKKGVLLAVCHFGAVELIGPRLACEGIPFTGTLKFATAGLSNAAKSAAQNLSKTGLFAEIQFIEVGSTTSASPLEMAAVLRRGELLMSVFDELTRYSTEVTLFGKKVLGGAGLQKLVSFMHGEITVCIAFAVRRENETYTLHVASLDTRDKSIIQTMYRSFETITAGQLDQWYFLHEGIPFVK